MILRSLLSLLLLVSLWSCGSSSDKTEDTSPCAAANSIVAEATYSSLWSNVFSGRCGTCHGAAATGTLDGPDMRTKEAFYANVVGKATTDYKDWDDANITLKDCLSTAFIKPGSSAQSVVVGTLDATVSLGCTPKPHKDPPQNICISNGSLAALKKWIDNGAAQ